MTLKEKINKSVGNSGCSHFVNGVRDNIIYRGWENVRYTVNNDIHINVCNRLHDALDYSVVRFVSKKLDSYNFPKNLIDISIF